MIDLSQAEPFASGANRLCFRHPEQPGQCLKVLKPGILNQRYQHQPRLKRLLGRQRLDDNRQEQQGYEQPAIAGRIAGPDEALLWRHLPRLYGTVQTTLGPANLSDLITDSNGEPGRTLEFYLRQGLTDELSQAIEQFCQWLLDTEIQSRNLLPHNLVLSNRSGRPELFLVDGLGAPMVQRLLARHPTLRQRAIQRKIRRFHRRIQWELGGRREPWESVQNR
ncbi:YrbL family protein [Marinobacter sp. SS21]|uniref:YrbL family protein n=1 Tax=Marinobacter sp. SS21 TaxID=2979460 RepID=UPI00232C12F4|nr:YrbL family protein [Marinobacter sp. SS21]MDC0663098.1 YrbL family protein [Marinobacter sp. SS21]